MFAGIDFPSLFESDNFTSRRTTGNNMLDPESLISGQESASGLTYDNSRRNWEYEYQYHGAVHGGLTTEEILRFAPRAFLAPITKARKLRGVLPYIPLGA